MDRSGARPAADGFAKRDGMGKINAAWHNANRMPKNPTLDQRIAWHIGHAEYCGCRPIAGKLRDEMVKRGIKVPVFKPKLQPSP